MAKSTAKPSRRYIEDLKPGDRLDDQVFLIGSKDLRTTTNGSLYIHCVLRDRTGQLLSRIWQATEPMYEQMVEGGFLSFRGRLENYKGSLQFIIDGMRATPPDEVDLADFLPKTRHDVDEMFKRVKEILRKIEHPALLALIKEFVTDEELMARFRRAPAAVQNHHAFIGGLLEHTLNLLELTLLVIPRYPEVSLDLMLAGVFLHDIGKTAELVYETNFQYSTEGQLVGHIVQASQWIEEKARCVAESTGEPFPAHLKAGLQHIVLAHHGRYEYGSPKLPAMPEAIALHHLDNLDAKLYMYLDKIRAAPASDGDWTEYVRSLETRILRKNVTAEEG